MTGDRITLSKDDAGSEAAHAFAKQRGGALPFQQLDPTSLAAFALRIGRSVLSDVLAGRSESTSTQSNQGSLALVAGERIDVTLIDRALINGVAGRQDNTYVAALYTGLPVVIAEIASAIWANPRFMPWLGLELEDSARPIHLASQQVPPGMGMLAHLCSELDADELSALAAHMRSVSLEAIAGHAGAISPLRTSALVRTIADADVALTGELVAWADVIFVMEPIHGRKLRQRFGRFMKSARLVCLDIPDDYDFMAPALVALLERKVPRYLP